MNELVLAHPAELQGYTADVVRSFLAGRSANTLRAYARDLEDFRRWVGTVTVGEAADALLRMPHGEANAYALAYRADLLERGLSAATVNRRLAALRSLVKVGRTLGLVPWELEVENLSAEPYRDTRGPGVDGFRRMLATVNGNGMKARRDRALLRLLFDLALRRSEVVGLDLEDVNLEAGTVEILGKGRTGKEIRTLPRPTVDTLRAYLDVRGSEPGALFWNASRTHRRTRLTAHGLAKVVHRIGWDAGLGHVRPHGLRHAAITQALDATGGDVRAVQRFSRHRDLRVLNVYDDNRTDLAGKVAELVASSV